MTTVKAYAANEVAGKLVPFSYELPDIGGEEVDVKVHYCGICHSDLSMLNNEWGMTTYPFVPGHEIIGEVVAVYPTVEEFPMEQVNAAMAHLEVGKARYRIVLKV